jgi:hypothetical protein
MRNRFKNIDLIKLIPEEYKESSYLGVCSSFFFLGLAALLIYNQLLILLQNEVYSEIEVDHFKDDKDLTVNLAIRLHAYPCGLLSLDKLDQVHTHTMDVEEGLQKIRIDSKDNVIGLYKNNPLSTTQERFEAIRKQIEDEEGCYMKGTFSIKLVPGNFHLSFHNYFAEFQMAMSSASYRPDLSYTIEHLYFGDCDENKMTQLINEYGLEPLHTLKEVSETDLLGKLGFPHGVEHRINIVPSKFVETNGTATEAYQFTSNTRLFRQTNNIAMTFAFDLENLKMVYHKRSGTFSHFCIQSVAILGGMYMFMFLLKSFIEDGILDLIYKRRIGKLE